MLGFVHKLVDNPQRAQQRVQRLLADSGLPYLRDVVIPDEIGGYTQIDHLLLTAQGLVALEWQFMSGVLHGSDFSQDWTRFEGKERHEFENPLRRVQKLVRSLDKLVLGEQKDLPLHSYLVLSGSLRFAKAWPQGVLDENRLRDWLATQTAAIPSRYRLLWGALQSRVACEPVNP
ncbi:MAG: nuclease-related domain-containing protein [Pseudomonadota bacterium]